MASGVEWEVGSPREDGPPLSGPTLFGGPLPPMTEEGSDAMAAAAASGEDSLTSPTTSASQLLGQRSLGHSPLSPTRAAGPRTAVPLYVAEEEYMDEFDAWLRAKFGYGRDSVAETEALEASLAAGGDVPGAVRIPFLARRYYWQAMRRPQQQQMGAGHLPVPPRSPVLSPPRSRETARPASAGAGGWVGQSGRLEPLPVRPLREADVEMSIRPAEPGYFRDTYEALVGRVARSGKLAELRAAQAAAGPGGGIGGTMFLGRPVAVELRGGLGATPEGGRRRSSPLRSEPSELVATPSSFAFAPGLEDTCAPPSRCSRRWSRAAPPSPLAVKGTNRPRPTLRQRPASASPTLPSRPTTRGSAGRPGTADSTSSAAAAVLEQRRTQLIQLAGAVTGQLAKSFAGLAATDMEGRVPSTEELEAAGSVVSCSLDDDAGVLSPEATSDLLQALMDWPYAGRPFEVAQYIADLVSPLPLFRMMDPELRPFICQHLVYEAHPANQVLAKKSKPHGKMAVVLSGTVLLSPCPRRKAKEVGEGGGTASRRTIKTAPAGSGLLQEDSFTEWERLRPESVMGLPAATSEDEAAVDAVLEGLIARAEAEEELDIAVASRDGMARHLALRPGEAFGSGCLAAGRPEPAEFLAAVAPEMAAQLATLSSRVYMLVRLQLAAMQRLEGLPALRRTLQPEALADVVADMDLKVAEAGQVVLREGDPGARFFVILNGHAVVTVTDPAPVDAASAPRHAASSAPKLARSISAISSFEKSPPSRDEARVEAGVIDKLETAETAETAESALSGPDEACGAAGDRANEAADGVFSEVVSKGGVAAAKDHQAHRADSSPPATASRPSSAAAPLVSGCNVLGDSAASIIAASPGGAETWAATAAEGRLPRPLAGALARGAQLVKRVLGPGDCFGEAALLGDTPRSASVIAASPELEMLTLDRTGYFQLLAGAHSLAEAAYTAAAAAAVEPSLSPVARTRGPLRPAPRLIGPQPPPPEMSLPVWPEHAPMVRQLLAVPPGQRPQEVVHTLTTALRALPAIGALPWAVAADVASHAAYVNVAVGEAISLRARPAASFVLSGTVLLQYRRSGGGGNKAPPEKTVLARLTPGERFGELGLLEGRAGLPSDLTAGSSAVAETEVELLYLSGAAYEAVLAADDLAALGRLASALGELDPFSTLSQRRLLALAALSRSRRVARGEVVLAGGKLADAAVVVMRGECRVRVSSERRKNKVAVSALDVLALGEGDHIGLAGVLSGGQPMVGDLVGGAAGTEVLCIGADRLGELLLGWGPRVSGLFMECTARQDAAQRKRLRNGTAALLALVSEDKAASINDSPELVALMKAATALKPPKPLRTGAHAAADVDNASVELINPAGGGHHSLRVPEPSLAPGVVEPRAADPIEIRMRAARREQLDELEEMSRQTRVRRLGPKAIGVSVPMPEPASKERKPMPGVAPRPEPVAEPTLWATDASVMPTRGTGPRPTQHAAGDLAAETGVQRLPADVKVFRPGYHRVLSSSGSAAAGGLPEAEGEEPKEVDGEGDGAPEVSAEEAELASLLLPLERPGSASRDGLQGLLTPMPWPDIPAPRAGGLGQGEASQDSLRAAAGKAEPRASAAPSPVPASESGTALRRGRLQPKSEVASSTPEESSGLGTSLPTEYSLEGTRKAARRAKRAVATHLEATTTKRATGPAAERDTWIRNTYFQAVVVPTRPSHRLVRMDLLAQVHSKHNKHSDADVFVQLPNHGRPKMVNDVDNVRKAREEKKERELAATLAQQAATDRLISQAKTAETWKGFDGSKAKPRESMLPTAEKKLPRYEWELDNFSSEEGYIGGILDEGTDILYFN